MWSLWWMRMMDEGDGGILMGLMGADDAVDLKKQMRGDPKFSNFFIGVTVAAGTLAALPFDWLVVELPAGVALVTDIFVHDQVCVCN
jgi:hypothetical protein